MATDTYPEEYINKLKKKFKVTYEWLKIYYGSHTEQQAMDTKKWLLRYGSNVPPEKLNEWAEWKHLSEYQVNTENIVPKCLDMIGKSFESELHVHFLINCMRVPGNSEGYISALKKIKPPVTTILELGVGGDSAISTAVFLFHLEKVLRNDLLKEGDYLRMLSIDHHPLGMTMKRYEKVPFWEFEMRDSHEKLEELIKSVFNWDLIFIDTIHSYPHTIKEIELSSKISDNILLDDIDFEGNDFDKEPGGVKRAREVFLSENAGWKEIVFEGKSVSLLQRKRKTPKRKKK